MIKEFVKESLLNGKSTSFIGAKDPSYKCKNVYLNIMINSITKKIDIPNKINAFESYVIYPDGYREYFDSTTLAEILESLTAEVTEGFQ